MKIEELTLQQFKDFILENIFDAFNFQYNESWYRQHLDEKELEEMFSYKKVDRLNSKNYPYLSFRLGLKHEDIDEISFYYVKKLFDDFINNSDLENLENHHIAFDYYSTQDYEFELTLGLWVKKVE